MIPIIHFCWQAFKPHQIPEANVGQLFNLASSQGQPFVFHDPIRLRSALVFPRLVTDLVQRFDISHAAPATAVGLLDLIQQNQIRVHLNQPATLVATLAIEHRIHTVIAVDDNAAPAGLFMPDVVRERLARTSWIQHQSSPKLQETVQDLTGRGDLAGAIMAIDNEHEEFHSETLNQYEPDPYVCSGDNNHGSHPLSNCPCPINNKTSCGRQQVTSA